MNEPMAPETSVAQHTPGEWYVHELQSRVPFAVEVRAPAGTAYRTVALLRSLTHDRADAHLIAAAPDLLALARRVAEIQPCMVESEGHICFYCGLIRDAEAAIARATGGAQ